MSNLSIHPDFQSIRAMATPTKRLPLALMNGFLSLVNALYLSKYKNIISKQKIRSSDGHQISLLIIKPENLPTSSPVLVYYPGGAFVFKRSPRHVDNAVRYARQSNCLVVFVDYRLAPKHPFPAGFNDCYDTLKWTFANADKLGIDKQRIAVGGDSAGGAMAAAAAQRAVHEDGLTLCGQLLIYPATDSSLKWPSVEAFANVQPFKALSYRAVWETYLGHSLATGTPRYAAPLQGELSGVARAYVEPAEFCPLRDEGNAYAQALAAKSVAVVVNATKGTVHGFDLLAPKSEISKTAMQTRVQFLRKIFRSEGHATL